MPRLFTVVAAVVLALALAFAVAASTAETTATTATETAATSDSTTETRTSHPSPVVTEKTEEATEKGKGESKVEVITIDVVPEAAEAAPTTTTAATATEAAATPDPTAETSSSQSSPVAAEEAEEATGNDENKVEVITIDVTSATTTAAPTTTTATTTTPTSTATPTSTTTPPTTTTASTAGYDDFRAKASSWLTTLSQAANKAKDLATQSLHATKDLAAQSLHATNDILARTAFNDSWRSTVVELLRHGLAPQRADAASDQPEAQARVCPFASPALLREEFEVGLERVFAEKTCDEFHNRAQEFFQRYRVDRYDLRHPNCNELERLFETAYANILQHEITLCHDTSSPNPL
eukprot:m.155670 g.155670  ORF g.155670 m.155670 type:complete len:352 (+) comp16968_c3_seq2:153-1208(+)